MTRPYSPAALQALRTPILAMAAVIVLSNVLVQHPINDWLTWGAITYPVAFLAMLAMQTAYYRQVWRKKPIRRL